MLLCVHGGQELFILRILLSCISFACVLVVNREQALMYWLDACVSTPDILLAFMYAYGHHDNGPCSHGKRACV